MGRGDIKTRKGKIFKGSFGVLRLRKKKKPVTVEKPKKATANKKAD